MPPIAVGRTTFRMVRHLGMPRAREASRSSFGTSLSISSVERTTTGIIRMARAIAPAKPEGPKPSIRFQVARMKRPATIDGMPVMTSTKKVTAWASFPPPYSTR
ncbi:hypothetical protein STANM309S_04711 [Streptomyces tanashiensis]